jgi:hypothetical protein
MASAATDAAFYPNAPKWTLIFTVGIGQIIVNRRENFF